MNRTLGQSPQAFLECALGNDDARSAMKHIGTDGIRLCATDGHRAHIIEHDHQGLAGSWKCVDPDPSLDESAYPYPNIDTLLEGLPKGIWRYIKLDVDQRRHLRLLCAAVAGINAMHGKEWKREPKKKRADKPRLTVIVFQIQGDRLWAGMTLGERPGILSKEATKNAWAAAVAGEWESARMLDLGPVDDADDLRWGVDADYLADVLDTLYIAEDRTITHQNPYHAEKIPADSLVIELYDGYNAGRFYSSGRPCDFALIMPVRV